MYRCAECGSRVILGDDGTVLRSCEHTEAPVIAEAAAGLAGQGGVR